MEKRACHRLFDGLIANVPRVTLRPCAPPFSPPCSQSATSLSGIGPKLGAALSGLLRGGHDEARLVDLLFHMPSGMVDRRNRPEIANAAEGALCTILIRVDRHQKPANSKQPYRVFGHDETGELALTFFRGQGAWLEKQLPVGEKRYVSGKVDWFNGRPSMVHPDYIVAEDALETLPMVEPVYPLVAAISTEGDAEGDCRRARRAADTARMAEPFSDGAASFHHHERVAARAFTSRSKLST